MLAWSCYLCGFQPLNASRKCSLRTLMYLNPLHSQIRFFLRSLKGPGLVFVVSFLCWMQFCVWGYANSQCQAFDSCRRHEMQASRKIEKPYLSRVLALTHHNPKLCTLNRPERNGRESLSQEKTGGKGGDRVKSFEPEFLPKFVLYA